MLKYLIAILTLAQAVTFAQTASVTASWDDTSAATDNITVFRLYYGTTSAVYTQTIDVAFPAKSVVVPNLTPGTKYYFAVQARAVVLQSALSNLTTILVVPLVPLKTERL